MRPCPVVAAAGRYERAMKGPSLLSAHFAYVQTFKTIRENDQSMHNETDFDVSARGHVCDSPPLYLRRLIFPSVNAVLMRER